MDKLIKNIGLIILFFLFISGVLVLYNAPSQKLEEISLSQLVNQISSGEVKEIIVRGNELEIELNDGKKEKTSKEMESSLGESLDNYGVNKEKLKEIKVEIKKDTSAAMWAGLILPFLLPFLLIGGFIWFMMRQAQRGNTQALSFGMSRARMTDPKTKKRR